MTTGAANQGDGLVEVRVLGIPVSLYREASQHHEELRREFVLIASEVEGGRPSDLPDRLLQLIDDLTQRFEGFTSEPRERLNAAMANGEQSIDLVYRVPAAVGPAAAEFDALLDEADDYCREGSTLLTLATPARAADFRRWFLGEFTRQAAGGAPRPWST